tara:strand:+ start:390 stop:836 length:447 start_codon:yes stop_codon:yes gene_type:complete
MDDIKKSGIAKLKKLGLTDEEINAMLGIEEELPPAEELAIAEERNELSTVAWKQDFLIEQLGYYNLAHDTNYELEDWINCIEDESISVHFDWKELAGIRPYPLNDASTPEFKALAKREKKRVEEQQKEATAFEKEYNEWIKNKEQKGN